jgi:hypothetical protein
MYERDGSLAWQALKGIGTIAKYAIAGALFAPIVKEARLNVPDVVSDNGLEVGAVLGLGAIAFRHSRASHHNQQYIGHSRQQG